MFRFCQLNTVELMDIRNFTLKTICRIFCANQCEVPLPIGYLAHIIRIVSSALSSGVQSTISIVIQHTKPIFTLDYRGLLVLIPLYIQQVKVVLNLESGFSAKARSASVSILASLLSVPDHYVGHEIPPIVKAADSAKSAITTMLQVKQMLYDEILKVLHRYTSATPETHKMLCKAICCATVIIYIESTKHVCNADVIKVSSTTLF